MSPSAKESARVAPPRIAARAACWILATPRREVWPKALLFFFVLVVSKGCKPQYRSRFKRMRYIPTTACALSFSFALSKKPPPPPITGRVSTRHEGSTMTLRSAWSPSVFPHRILLGFWMPLPLPPPKPPPYLSYPLPPPLGRARFQARRTLARACFLLFLVLRRRRLRGLRRIFRFRLRLATDMRDETIGAYRAEDCRGDEGSSRWISKWTGLDWTTPAVGQQQHTTAPYVLELQSVGQSAPSLTRSLGLTTLRPRSEIDLPNRNENFRASRYLERSSCAHLSCTTRNP